MKLWPFNRERRSLRLTPDAEATINGTGFGFDDGTISVGRAVSAERSLGTSPVYSCVVLIAKLIGGMPLGTWRRGPDDSTIAVKGTPLANMLRYEPMPGVTATTFWATVVVHLLLRGNAFLVKVKVQDAAGRTRVSALRILHPDLVEVLIDGDGNKVFRVRSTRGGPARDLTRDDVVHIVGMSFGTGLVGHSVVAVMRHRLSAHVAASDHQDDMLSNGLTAKAKMTIPGIYADTEDDTKRNLIRNSLRKFYGGARNAGNNVVFLDSGWDLDAISITPHDAQFLEQYRFTFTEVAGWFSVPAGAIGAEGAKGLHYTSASMNDLDLLKKGVKYWVEAIENALLIDPDLFGVQSGRSARFNVDSMLEVDILTRFQTFEIGSRIGMYSPNDQLRIEGRPLRDDPGGDMYVTPALNAGGAAPNTNDTPKEGTDDADAPAPG